VYAVAAFLRTDGRLAGNPERGRLAGMRAAMRHRLRRSSAIAHAGPVVLLSSSTRHHDLLVSADARIDNAAELASLLSIPADAPPHRFIRAAYDAWGPAAPERLTGDFAFVLWDHRRRRLVAARDQLGVKPLYYAAVPGFLALASEMKGLLAIPELPADTDPARVADFLEGVLEDTEATFYRHVRRLPPGHLLVAEGDAISLSRYWSLDPDPPTPSGDDAAWIGRVRDVFTSAVRSRLPDDEPVGAMLSGGLDSSSIACVARDLLAAGAPARALHTFSAVFPGLDASDERRFIDAVLATGHFIPHRVDATTLRPLESLDVLLDQQDEPRLAANLYVTQALLASARDADVGVVLDGIDGDTVVSHGIRRLSELARDRRWSEFAAESAGVARLRQRAPLVNVRHYALPEITSRARSGQWTAVASDVAQLARHASLSPWKLAREALLEPLLAAPLRRRIFRHSAPDPSPPRRLTSPELYHATRAAERHAEARAAAASTERQDHHWRLTRGITAYGFEVMDHAAAACGIDVRFPFYDRRFVELSLSVPGSLKLRDGWTRYVLRRAMHGILPPEIQWRVGKANVGAHLQRSLLEHHRQALDDLVYGSGHHRTELDCYLDREFLRQQYGAYKQTGGERAAVSLWKALTFSRWLQRRGASGARNGLCVSH
jgi:asparagine synthase (glutamine-hydrolysing)